MRRSGPGGGVSARATAVRRARSWENWRYRPGIASFRRTPTLDRDRASTRRRRTGHCCDFVLIRPGATESLLSNLSPNMIDDVVGIALGTKLDVLAIIF